MLDDDQLLRYSRQLLLPEIDIEGQQRLNDARVLVVGAGGLGNPAALYLAGAGVGEITLIDGDRVETSNLQRQIAFREYQRGENKAQALAAQLHQLNGLIRVHAFDRPADAAWLEAQLSQLDLVLDCSDNFATRALVNRACVAHRVPLVSGAAIRFAGQIAAFDFREPDCGCYACLYGEQDGPDTLCSESGVLGPVVGVVGAMQALLAIRLLCGLPVARQLHRFDAHTLAWHSTGFARDPHCPVCAPR